MPSTKDPNLVVNPGPGRLPEGSVTASSLTFVSGGGSDAGLMAHITDPVDAHMASAIGIPEYDPLTGYPLLSTVPEDPLKDFVFDGESVLDALRMLRELMPPRPNRIGWAETNTPNSGAPSWGVLEPYDVGGNATIGAWTDGTNLFRPSRAIVDNGTSSAVLSGMVFPADRGVLAIYHNTDGTFATGTTTLVGALYLGTSPPPTGLAGAGFVEANRNATQTNYTPAGTGVDKITLTDRIGYKKDYAAWGIYPYDDYASDFNAYQLATYAITLPVSTGDAGSYLIVHWREQYASSLTAISTFNEADVVNANCYSITPEGVLVPSGETKWDTAWVKHVAKRNIYRDPSAALFILSPTITQSAIAGTTTTLSGVPHYTGDLTSTLQWSVSNLFSRNYYNTGVTANPPDVPPDFLSIDAPLAISFADFGASTKLVKAYTDLKDGGGNFFNATTNVPLAADSATLGPLAAVAIPYTVGEYGVGPELLSPGGANTMTSAAQVQFELNGLVPGGTPTTKIVFNSYPQTGGSTVSTETLEKFLDEKYRIDWAHLPSLATSDALPPTGAADYNSSLVLAANSAGPQTTAKQSLQVVGGRLQYPRFDFSAAPYTPTGPNYNALFLGDVQYTQRTYARAFNTGMPRSTGRLRIKGLAFNAFKATGAVVGSAGNFSDHAGRAVITLKIPGATGFLDLGRFKGDPDLNYSADWRGCLTGITTGGSEGDIYEFDMTGLTTDNGAGKFLLYVAVVFVKDSPAGTSVGTSAIPNIFVDEIEWLPPL